MRCCLVNCQAGQVPIGSSECRQSSRYPPRYGTTWWSTMSSTMVMIYAQNGVFYTHIILMLSLQEEYVTAISQNLCIFHLKIQHEQQRNIDMKRNSERLKQKREVHHWTKHTQHVQWFHNVLLHDSLAFLVTALFINIHLRLAQRTDGLTNDGARCARGRNLAPSSQMEEYTSFTHIVRVYLSIYVFGQRCPALPGVDRITQTVCMHVCRHVCAYTCCTLMYQGKGIDIFYLTLGIRGNDRL